MQNSSITIKQALIRPHHLIPEPEIDPVIAFEFRVVEDKLERWNGLSL